MKLLTSTIEGQRAYHREGGDERILKEVLERACYRRQRLGFDVEAGERWLDLGANIGAFALYCKARGAEAICYEPDADCFAILEKNAKGFKCVNAAVTMSEEKTLTFFVSGQADNHSRGTTRKVRGYSETVVKNVHASSLLKLRVDGIKMDIEGSEGPILDAWALPPAEKLCMEYHTSRDASVDRLRRRLQALKRHYKHVAYPPEFDRVLASGAAEFKAHFDRMIFCWGLK